MSKTLEIPEAPSADPTDCANLACMLSRASHALTIELSAALDEIGISARDHSVLSQASQGEYSQIELARIVDLDKTTMVATLDELEAAGLAERQQSKTDRRARVIVVTPEAKKLLRKADKVTAGVLEDVLGALSSDEQSSFTGALSKLVEGPLADPAECGRSVRRRNNLT
jgi:DNA-binding MarR family transcriptional regulator